MIAESEVKRWPYSRVSEWLQENGLGDHIPFFARHQIDGEVLLSITENDLKSPPLNLTVFGQIRKIAKALERLKQTLIYDDGGNRFGFATNEFSRALAASTDTVPSEHEAVKSARQSQRLANRDKPEPISIEKKAAEIKQFYPDYCWQMDENQEQFLKVFLDRNSLIDARFLADVSTLVSPIEFYLQPHILSNEVHNLKDRMDDFYKDATFDAIPFKDFAFEGMSCVALFNEDDSFYRAKIDHMGGSDCKLSFFDWGNGQFEPYARLKPLVNEFAEIPPLALKCRIDGVLMRTLVQKRLDEFRHEIEQNCQKQVYCAIKRIDHDTRTFIVDIFHPKTMENIGARFYPSEPIVPGFSVPMPVVCDAFSSFVQETLSVATPESAGANRQASCCDRVSDDDVQEVEGDASSVSDAADANESPPSPTPGTSTASFDQSRIVQIPVEIVPMKKPKAPIEPAVPVSVAIRIAPQKTNYGDVIPKTQPSLPIPTPKTPHSTPVGSFVQLQHRSSGACSTNGAAMGGVGGGEQNWSAELRTALTGLDAEQLKKVLAEKEEKKRQGMYANPLEAFLDGAPMDSDDDLDDDDYDQNKRKKRAFGKKKTLKQINAEIENVNGINPKR